MRLMLKKAKSHFLDLNNPTENQRIKGTQHSLCGHQKILQKCKFCMKDFGRLQLHFYNLCMLCPSLAFLVFISGWKKSSMDDIH